MDISTLLGAQTATAPAALSFGVLGGGNGNAVPSGEGLDGLDSFNQLLGNFLSVTGGEGLTGEAATIPTEGMEGPVVTGMSTPRGLGALLGGGLRDLNLANLAGNGTATAAAPKGVEARWSQSGITLLGGNALTGQELNPEVVDFLNDLSSAFAAANPLSEEAPAIGDGMEGEITAQETDLLTVMQGSDGTMTIVMEKMVQLTAALTAPVIPVMTATDTAPTALGVNLTVAGTGLKALPTVPDAGPAAPAPQATPVIPKLDAPPPAILSDATAAAQVAATPASAAANDDTAQPALTAPPAGTPSKATPAATAAAQPLPAAPVPQTIPAAPVATQAATAQPAAQAGDGTVGAVALPAGLAAPAAGDQNPVTVAAAPAKITTTTVPVAGTNSAPAAEKPVAAAPKADVTAAPTPQAAAKQPVSDSQPVVKQPETVATATVATNTGPAADANATPKPAAAPAAPVTLAKAPAQMAEAKPTVKAAQAAPLTQAPAPADAELAASDEATATDADPVTSTSTSTSNNPTPHSAPSRPTAAASVAKPTLTTATRQATDATAAPAPEQVAAEQAVSEEEEAPARRMLAPKHVSAEARAETEMAGQAQSAGQNQPATRNDGAAPAARGTEDSLLARAVGAAGRGHEGGSATDGEGSGSGFADPAPADSTDPASASVHTGESAKTQATDFAQSLRQTSAPHRPNAYAHPGQQMAIHMQRAVADGNDRVSIQLNPYELGRIDVQLEIGAEGKLRAKVMVENPQTLEMLQKDAKSLEKALQEAGLQTDKDSLSFSLQDSGDQARERQDHQDQSNRGTALASDDVEEEDPAIIAQAQIMELGRVDVRV